MTIKKIGQVAWVESGPDCHVEKIISIGGGFIGILLTMWVSLHYVGAQGAALLVASMGSSAVLLFATPHSTFAQPWPLLGGHVICALIGIACAQIIPNPLLAAPLSVALSIAAMCYFRCIHPPAGGTALVAVIGGSDLLSLGYQFVLTPVLLNTVLLLCTAVVVNYVFPWRRYPAFLKQQPNREIVDGEKTAGKLSHEDFEYARGEIGSYVDISEDDLAKLYDLATQHARQMAELPMQISVGHFYSNGEYGSQWSVAKVTELHQADATVTFEIVAGDKLSTTNTSSMADFSRRQKYEVILENGSWQRLK